MPHARERADPVAEAVALAQDIGGDIASILLTHYPDAETLDTLRPGGPDLATVTATNRAVAAELAAQGVEIFVQKADRAAFRRWMQGRDDTPEARRRWVDRTRLLRGAEALRLLGVAPPPPPPTPRFAAAPGPIADRLLAAFLDGDDADDGFAELAEALLAAGRHDVLDLAVRKAATSEGDEAADALELDLLATAEAARLGPSGWAGLVTLPVALPPGTLPDAEALGTALAGTGIASPTVEQRFLPGWRSPDALAALSPAALRRVLLALLAGADPADLPPADTDELASRGFGVLLGLEIDWDIPVWDEIVATGLPDEDDEDAAETPDEARRARLFDTWRAAVFEAHDGCVPLALVPPSEAGAEIAAFMDEAGQHTDCIDEIREFIAMARREAGGDEVVCRAEILGDTLELALYTTAGRFLDSLSLTADRMPASAAEMLRVVGGFVRMVPDTPGR